MTDSLSETIKKHLIQEYGLNSEDVDMVYAASVESIKQNIQDLENIDQAPDKSASRLAHTLKGNLLNMGLSEIAQLARELEEELIQGDVTTLEHRLPEIKKHLAEVL
jgi:HPt (histidine-containing phosphotransfer) domain-containing protein